MQEKKIVLHESQMQAFTSTARIIACIAGKQGGKTTIGGLWSRAKASADFGEEDNAIIAAPNYKIFSQSTYPKFREFFPSSLGRMDKKDMAYKVNGGGTIYLRSMHDPDSCEGITNVKWIWGDEAGKMRVKAWNNLNGRAAFKQAPIFLTTTPYALNWLYKDVYKPFVAGKLKDTQVIQWYSIDNPYFPKAEYERQKSILDPRIFRQFYHASFEKMHGLVYPDLDEEKNFEDPFIPNPRDYFICGGIDFGYQNPFAVSVRALHRREPRDYQVAEFYETRMLKDQIIEKLKQLMARHGIEVFYADSEDPGMIAEISAAGIPVMPVKKGKDSVQNGIIIHGSLIKSGEYKLLRGQNPNTEDEYSTYHYPEDAEVDENKPELPVKDSDHLMDSNRYVSMSTVNFRKKRDEEKIPANYNGKSYIEELYEPEEEMVDWYNA